MMREAVKRFNLGKPLPPDLSHLLDHNIHADLRDQLWQQNRDRKLTGAATTAAWGKIALLKLLRRDRIGVMRAKERSYARLY